MFTLDNFEDGIDNDFLRRGFEYFNAGKILIIKETDKGKWKAKIRGNFDYNVNVILADREIIESFCDCPYEGDFCKHEIAVFYALAGDDLNIKKPKELPLSKMSKEQLFSLVEQGRNEFPEFDEFVAAELKMIKKDKFDKIFFKEIIVNSLNYAKDRHGFIDYWQSRKATIGAEKVYEQARDFEDKNQILAIDAYGSIIENLVPALQYSDDSDGMIGEMIDFALAGLGQVANNIKNQDAREYLFKYCAKEALDKKYHDWHFGLDLLRILGLIALKNEKDKLFGALDNYLSNIDSEYNSEYEAEKVALVKLAFIEKYEEEIAAEVFIAENLHLNDIREEAVKRVIKKNDLAEAKKIANDGIEINKNKYPGLVHTYLKFLFEISELENDYDAKIDFLLQLFLNGSRHEFEYFNKLKSLSKKDDWPLILEKIKKNIDNAYDLAQIFDIEKDWPKLLQIVKNSNSHYLVDQYFDQLKKYPEELVKIYEKLVYEGIEYAGGRGDYSQRARFLGVIYELGYIEMAKKIGQELKEKYKNRRAMIEEFSKAGF